MPKWLKNPLNSMKKPRAQVEARSVLNLHTFSFNLSIDHHHKEMKVLPLFAPLASKLSVSLWTYEDRLKTVIT